MPLQTQAATETSRTVRGINSIYVSELQATVENDQVKNFRVNIKISFVVEKVQG